MVKFLNYNLDAFKRLLLIALAAMCVAAAQPIVPASAAGNGSKKPMKFVVGPVTVNPDKSGKGGGNKSGGRPQDGSGQGPRHP